MLLLSNSEFNRLSAAYSKLSPLEQTAIQMLSVIYEPTNQTTLLKCLRRIGAKTAEGKTLSGQDVKGVLSALRKEGFIGDQIVCHPSFVEEATTLAVESGQFPMMVKAVQEEIPALGWNMEAERYIREIRIGVYSHNLDQIRKFYHLGLVNYPQRFTHIKIFAKICNNPFRPLWFRKLPLEIRASALLETTSLTLQDLASPVKITELLAEYRTLAADEQSGPYLRDALARILIFQGRLDEALQVVKQDQDKGLIYAELVEAWCDFLRGNNDQAIARYQAALKRYRKGSDRRKLYFRQVSGLFFILALMKTGQPDWQAEMLGFIRSVEEKQDNNEYLGAYRALKATLLFQRGETEESKITFSLLKNARPNDQLSIFFFLLATYWIERKLDSEQVCLLKALFSRAEDGGYLWFSMESANLLAALFPDDPHYRRRVEEIQGQTGMRSIFGLIRYEADWERGLKALINLASCARGVENTTRESRLVWLISFRANYCSFQPLEQKLTKSGTWSKGRPIALSRLYGQKNLPFLTPQDQKICSTISVKRDYWQTTYHFDWKKTLPAMIGHPLLFLADNPEVRIELVSGSLELIVDRKGNQFRIRFSEEVQDIADSDIIVVREGLSKYKVIEVSAQQQAIAKILGPRGLVVPIEAKDRVLEALASLSALVTVQSGVEGKVKDIEEVEADSRIHVHLLPTGSGVRLKMLVRPLSQAGPYFKPGLGGSNIIAEIDGKRVQTTRDLREEIHRAKGVVAACPILAGLEGYEFEWLIEGVEDCLQTLLDLHQIEGVQIEWPEGEKLKVISRPISFDQMRLKIHRESDWFSASGELQVDSSRVLDMRRLLELMESSPGRFIPLGEGEFLALTNELRKRLDELRAFSEQTAKGVRFHSLASLALRDLTDSVGSLEADEAWREHIEQIDRSRHLMAKVPSTLQAQLRDYQVDGFMWLAQLARWGVGACLADDMGLGKTVQALALILDRAAGGPTLVVAPTSVCMNWVEEANRFAPTLNIVQFWGKDRKKQLENLGAFDLLITSYALLQIEAESLSQIHWQTIVLDEAQAIKNMTTKRSQAAMSLRGEFKMITTGTPIENHLGELWTLFNFLNPGLLGSLEKFNQRFGIPIEKYHDPEARKRLKKLIQPFILRRTKSQVLEELPSRTEITLHVEMSNEELAFYEALRQEAIKRLEGLEGPAGQKHLKILAEIMKLRRACCHARLVNPNLDIESSKLALLAEVVEELLENRHKALIFSQFVDHLSIIREFLDERGISYQYLDGSTPARERKRRIEAFQAGDGDLFLISLRAGGCGLNLTAADFVIHMDPWWNPAVEDQASDRAHRIGQQRPVTIYRMVTRHTIEEKIVNLHAEKRDLASSLLEGSDMTGKMSADELIRLIREQ